MDIDKAMKQARVGFVVYVSPRENENIWACMLAATLREKGVDVRLFLLHANSGDIPRLSQEIIDFSPDLISLAIYDFNNLGVYFEDFAVVDVYGDLCSELKLKVPHLHINAASWFVSSCAEDYLQDHPEIDSIILGEGERTIINLLGHILSNQSLSTCNGVILRDNEKIVKTPRQEAITILDQLPFMARDMYKQGPARIATSRGCYAKCEFCSISYFDSFNAASQWRGRTPENIVAEMQYLVETHHVDTFEFEDGSFEDQGNEYNEGKFHRMLAICDLIIESNFNVLFAIFMRPATAISLSPDIWEKLREAGLYKIFIGVDSVDINVRKFYRKPNFDISRIAPLRIQLMKYDIEMRVGYIMFDPWVSFDRLEHSLVFLKQVDHLCWAQCWTPLELLPGLPIIEKIRDAELLTSEYRYDKPWAYNYIDERMRPLAYAIKDIMRAQPKELDTGLKLADIALHQCRRFGDRKSAGYTEEVNRLGDFLEEHRQKIATNNEAFLRSVFRLAEKKWSQQEFNSAVEMFYSEQYVSTFSDKLKILRQEVDDIIAS